jgi:hypothetical protein
MKESQNIDWGAGRALDESDRYRLFILMQIHQHGDTENHGEARRRICIQSVSIGDVTFLSPPAFDFSVPL